MFTLLSSRGINSLSLSVDWCHDLLLMNRVWWQWWWMTSETRSLQASFLSFLSVWGKPFAWVRTLNQPYQKVHVGGYWGLPTARWERLWKKTHQPQSSFKCSDDGDSGGCLDCDLMSDWVRSTQLNHAWCPEHYSYYKKLNACFMLLSYGVICYTAIDN